MTQRREKEKEEVEGLRRFKDSRTLREREEDAEERPKGGCSKSRGDEGELQRSAGWLCQSTSVYLAEECKRGAKVTFLTVGGRIAHVHSRCDNYGQKYPTYATPSVSNCRRKKKNIYIYISFMIAKPRSSFI